MILTTQNREWNRLSEVISIMQKFYGTGEDGLLDMLL